MRPSCSADGQVRTSNSEGSRARINWRSFSSRKVPNPAWSKLWSVWAVCGIAVCGQQWQILAKRARTQFSSRTSGILLVPPSFGQVLSCNLGSVSATGPPSIKSPLPIYIARIHFGTKSGTSKAQAAAHRGQCNLTMQCTGNRFWVNMGSPSVLVVALPCADTGGMRCVVLGPKGLKGERMALLTFIKKRTKSEAASIWLG